MVSYADFITLLFAFFTTLYAISTVDAQKLAAMVAALQSAFASPTARATGRGPGDPGAVLRAVPGPSSYTADPVSAVKPVAKGPSDLAPQPRAREASLTEVKAQLDARLDQAIRDGRVTVELERRGLVISIKEAGSFATGSAELSPATRQLIAEVAASIRSIGNAVRIEGHTDDVPIHTVRYASNWELSTARATNVVAYLIQEQGIEPVRLSAAGYSEFHPRAPNDSAANRARNRRVDIVILNPTTSQAEEPPGT